MSRGRGETEAGLRSVADINLDIITWRSWWAGQDYWERLEYRFPENLDHTDLSGLDLENVDLRGRSLYGADLSGANLRYARLQGADLQGIKYDLKTQFPGGKIDYLLNPEVGEHIKAYGALTSEERILVEKNPFFKVSEMDGLRKLTWLDGPEGRSHSALSPEGHKLPAVTHSLLLPDGSGINLHEEYHESGLLDDPVNNFNNRGLITDAAWKDIGTEGTHYKFYQKGKPHSPKTAEAQQPPWYKTESIDEIFSVSGDSGLIRGHLPHSILMRNDGSYRYEWMQDEVMNATLEHKDGLTEVHIYEDGLCRHHVKLKDGVVEAERTHKFVESPSGKMIIRTRERYDRPTGLGGPKRDIDMHEYEEFVEINGTQVQRAVYTKPQVNDGKVMKHNGAVREYYNIKGQLHSMKGPAYMQLDKNGRVVHKSFHIHGEKIRNEEAYNLRIQAIRNRQNS
jgi:hypothetical protein